MTTNQQITKIKLRHYYFDNLLEDGVNHYEGVMDEPTTNECEAGVDNISLTSTTEHTTGGNNGTLQNFTLSGSTSNRVE